MGVLGSRIAWRPAAQAWVISGIFGATNRSLTLRRPRKVYPFGLHSWSSDQVASLP